MLAVATRTQNPLSVASLLVGVVGVFPLVFAGAILGPTAIVMGVLGLRQIKRSGGLQKGSGVATVGIVAGFIGTALGVLWYVLKPLNAF